MFRSLTSATPSLATPSLATPSLASLPLASLLFATLIACGGSSEPAAPASPDAPAAQHADAGVTPGSHSDWCGEHAVPESQCTRCNASLVPAFKATGDWCDDHGLPQSQCTTCDPDLVITRPPKGG